MTADRRWLIALAFIAALGCAWCVAAIGCGSETPPVVPTTATPVKPAVEVSEKAPETTPAKPSEKAPEKAPEAAPGRIGEEDQRLLLAMAREQLTKIVKEGKTIDPRDYPSWKIAPAIERQGGTFVTLKNAGRLRGCIGDLEPRQALYRSVLANTVNAARRDYRFADDPVTAAELPNIQIEITALTPMQPIADISEIVVGKHGVLMRLGGAGAVFLPQVAVEQHWDRERLLRELCIKAGLPTSAYRNPAARFWVFEGQIFNESETRGK